MRAARGFGFGSGMGFVTARERSTALTILSAPSSGYKKGIELEPPGGGMQGRHPRRDRMCSFVSADRS